MPDYVTDHRLIHDHRDEVTEKTASGAVLVPTYRAYARGEQADTLTAEQKLMLTGVATYPRADNICHTIIAEAASRIELQRPEERQQPWCENAAVQAFIDEVSVKNALEDLEGEIYYNAMRDGNTYVRVYWNPLSKRIELLQELAWDGNEGMFYFAGDDLFPPYAVKEWGAVLERVDGQNIYGRRRYIYYEDRIESWVSRDNGVNWLPYPIKTPTWDPEKGRMVDVLRDVVPWVKEDGSPLHIPVVHFANAGRMVGKRQNYGLSELSGGILNKQDEINDTDAALQAATRFTGFSFIVVNGYTPDPEHPQEPLVIQLVPGSAFTDVSPDLKVSRVQPGEVQPIIDSKIEKLRAASRSSRTPLHNITGGDWPSGAALDKAETPAVNKAKRQAAKFAPALATMFHRATEIANVYGRAGLDEDALIRVTFNSFERRDPQYVLQLEQQQMALQQQKELMAKGINPAEMALKAKARGSGEDA